MLAGLIALIVIVVGAYCIWKKYYMGEDLVFVISRTSSTTPEVRKDKEGLQDTDASISEKVAAGDPSSSNWNYTGVDGNGTLQGLNWTEADAALAGNPTNDLDNVIVPQIIPVSTTGTQLKYYDLRSPVPIQGDFSKQYYGIPDVPPISADIRSNIFACPAPQTVAPVA